MSQLSEMEMSLFHKYIEYHTKEINYLLEPPPNKRTNLGVVISVIRGGSSKSFTNKVDIHGNLRSDIDRHTLYEDTYQLKEFIDGLSYHVPRALYKKNITVYRKINVPFSVDKYLGQSIPHPIPFSCSWTDELARGLWNIDSCCLFEITIPIDYPILFLSYPSNILPYHKPINYGWMNNPQKEVVLAPSFIKCSLISENINNMFIIKCTAVPMTIEEIRARFSFEPIEPIEWDIPIDDKDDIDIFQTYDKSRKSRQ